METFQYFITLPDEKLVFAERAHWIVITLEVLILLFLYIFFSGIAAVLLWYGLHSPLLFIAVFLVITCFMLSILAKKIIEWYLHLYIVTNKKMLEICYSPLFFYKITCVQLHEVRCTEIDERKQGILNELLDKGDIVITFDRPTHEEEFTLTHIQNPRQIARTLSTLFASLEQNNEQPIWYKTNKKPTLFPFETEIRR